MDLFSISFIQCRCLPKEMKTCRNDLSVFLLGLVKSGKSWERCDGAELCQVQQTGEREQASAQTVLRSLVSGDRMRLLPPSSYTKGTFHTRWPASEERKSKSYSSAFRISDSLQQKQSVCQGANFEGSMS